MVQDSGSDGSDSAEYRMLQHQGVDLSPLEKAQLQQHAFADLAHFNKWDYSREEDWFQQLLEPPCGLQPDTYRRVERDLMQVRGTQPLFVNKVLKTVCCCILQALQGINCNANGSSVIGPLFVS